MKLAILTLPLHNNFGGIIQAWALQTVLERMGHSVDVIDDVINRPAPRSIAAWKAVWIYPWRAIGKFTGRSQKPIRWEYVQRQIWLRARRSLLPFIRRNIHIRNLDSITELRESDYDGYVFGSDQVWRPSYINGVYGGEVRNLFGAFCKGWSVRRVAYAPSFGLDSVCEFTEAQLCDIANLLADFDAVSVREDSGMALLRNEFGVEACHVLDPTMLLTKSDYLELIAGVSPSEACGSVMTYILDPAAQKQNVANAVARKMGLAKYGTALAGYGEPTITMEEWLSAFRDAEFVVTDSFHASVFSILFGKPFVVVGNSSRGQARISSLLRMCGLEHHFVESQDSLGAVPGDYVIPPSVQYRLIELRNASMRFLTEAFV